MASSFVSRRRAVRVTAVVAAALGLAATATQGAGATVTPAAAVRSAGTPGTGTAPYLGTLGTYSANAATESSAGVKLGMVELSWKSFEPTEGVFDAAYARSIQHRIDAMQAAGMRITLGLGLHFTPAWAFAIPDSRFVNQDGATSDTIDLVFNQAVRDQADTYIDHVAATFDMSDFWAVRVTSGGSSEVLYPQGGTYWAFDRNAQNGPEMPHSMVRNPFPGWKPGTSGLTTAQVTSWGQWYIAALADVVNWQIKRLHHVAYTGYVQVVTPGLGVSPAQFASAATKDLPDGTLGAGAAWSSLYADLADKTAVTAYVSSVGDASGVGADRMCSPADDSVPLTSTTMKGWSATRWISRIADANGLTKAGENPGYSSAPAAAAHYTDTSSNGLMATAVQEATSCGFLGLYWAHDDQFWGSTKVMSLSTLTGWVRTGQDLPGLAPTS